MVFFIGEGSISAITIQNKDKNKIFFWWKDRFGVRETKSTFLVYSASNFIFFQTLPKRFLVLLLHLAN